MTSRPTVVVFDYGSGNVHSAVRALERVGADVSLTGDHQAALAADGLFVPGVGNFHACMRGLRQADGARLIDVRLAGGRPVLGVCVGMQVLFDGSTEPFSGPPEEGLGEWPGLVERLPAEVVPHMGWSTVKPGADTPAVRGSRGRAVLLRALVCGAAVDALPGRAPSRCVAPVVTWSTHGTDFVAAVENGPLCATQFHPEKSGDAGAQLLENWVRSL